MTIIALVTSGKGSMRALESETDFKAAELKGRRNFPRRIEAKCKIQQHSGQGQNIWKVGDGKGVCMCVFMGDVRGGDAASPPPPSPLLCPFCPPVDPTSIPLEFLSTSGWPLKEIGFKLWHELAPQIDLILPHPGDKKRRHTFFPLPRLSPHFPSHIAPPHLTPTPARSLSPLPLPSTSFALPFPILSCPPPHPPLP